MKALQIKASDFKTTNIVHLKNIGIVYNYTDGKERCYSAERGNLDIYVYQNNGITPYLTCNIRYNCSKIGYINDYKNIKTLEEMVKKINIILEEIYNTFKGE